jgi:hypothetical protein
LDQDHLFISYAGEDGALAEWLTLKLTTLGYKVWCDRVKLLGGESYPLDIDEAIKHRTFRMLALLSGHSISKPNPLKERTLALNLARERKQDFLIPLNVDGLPPTALDWMTSDLSYIPFTNWSAGLSALLKKLESVYTPRAEPDGAQAVRAWLDAGLGIREQPEKLWTNLIPVQLPPVARRVTFRHDGGGKWPEDLARYRHSEKIAWAFAEPDEMKFANVEQVSWKGGYRRYDGLTTGEIVTNLVQAHLDKYCATRGLRRAGNGDWFFPKDLILGDQLLFQTYTGRPTRTKVVGVRKFWTGRLPEHSRYHLSFVLKPRLFEFGDPVVLLRPRVILTELSGAELDFRKLVRRRKALCKSWFNHQWLSRVLGICALKLAPLPMRVECPISLVPEHTHDQVEPDYDDDDSDIVESEIPAREDDSAEEGVE